MLYFILLVLLLKPLTKPKEGIKYDRTHCEVYVYLLKLLNWGNKDLRGAKHNLHKAMEHSRLNVFGDVGL